MPVSKDILLTHIDYTRWASERLLEAAASIPAEEMERDLGSSYGGIFGTFAHIYQGDRIWLSRFERKPLMTLAEANDAPTFTDLRAKWPPLLKRFHAWVEQADPEATLDYHSLKGDPYSVPRWQALLHVVNHGSYHRGQIVTMMRQLGHKPVFTDLIYYFLKVE